MLAALVVAGLLSRMIPTGWLLMDKYLGDALYAATVYLLLGRRVVLAMAVMTAIERFQLTGIPAALVASGAVWERGLGRLLGTTFSYFDLTAYAVGIASFWTAGVRTERDR